jgi:hypothetical protein
MFGTTSTSGDEMYPRRRGSPTRVLFLRLRRRFLFLVVVGSFSPKSLLVNAVVFRRSRHCLLSLLASNREIVFVVVSTLLF